jgi:hypothetical protein
MMANIAGFATETVSDISMRATDNPEVREVLARLAIPNATTPHLDPPGPAIGMSKQLLPYPEEWGFEGDTSPILPAPAKVEALVSLPACRGSLSSDGSAGRQSSRDDLVHQRVWDWRDWYAG